MYRTLLASLLFSATILPASAEDLEDIYQLVQKSEPELKAAEAAYRATQATQAQTRALFLPNASISANRSENDIESPLGNSDYTGETFSISITQPVFRMSSFVQHRQTKLSLKQSESDLAAAKQQQILRTAERYFGVLSAQANLQFARSEKIAIAKQLEQAKKRFDVGLIAITDVHEAQSAYDLAIAAEITAINQVASAGEALSEITGRTRHQLAKLSGAIPLKGPEPANMTDWTQTALKQNLQLQSLEYSTRIAKQNIRLRSAGHYPTLDIIASRTDTDRGGPFATDNTTDSIALQLNIPLYSGGLTTAQTREASHLYTQAAENLEQQRRVVLRQTRDAYRGVINGISQVRALKQATISTKSAMETTQAGFDVGTRTIVDVLLAQRNLFRARRDYLQSQHDYILNILRLKQAAGTLAPADLKYFNQWLG